MSHHLAIKKIDHCFLLFNKVFISGYCGWSIRSHMVQKTSSWTKSWRCINYFHSHVNHNPNSYFSTIIKVHCNNERSIKLIKNHVFHDCPKHKEIHCHLTKEKVENKHIELCYILITPCNLQILLQKKI